MQPLIGRTLRLESPQPGEHLRQHTLEMRELDDAPGLIADWRQIADFRAPEQPLVFRVLLRDCV